MIHGQILDPGGKPLIEPEVSPPLHGHEIAKPLVGQLMGDDYGHALPSGLRRLFGVHEYRRFPIGDCTPVFHSARRKVRNGDQVHLR